MRLEFEIQVETAISWLNGLKKFKYDLLYKIKNPTTSLGEIGFLHLVMSL